MKKNFSVIYLLFFIILNYNNLQAQNYSEPSIAIKHNNFYPIGWSKNSLFAYIRYREAWGINHDVIITLIIQNTKTDNIVFEKNIFYGEDAREGSDDSPKNFSEAWQRNYNKFSNILKNYKIKDNIEGATLKQFPLHYSNDIYTIKLLKTNVDSNGFDYKMQIKSKKLGAKIITKNKADVDPAGNIEYFKVLGCFISPFEKRIAVLVPDIHIRYGEEGMLIGSHLMQRFKKENTNKETIKAKKKKSKKSVKEGEDIKG